MTSTIIDVLVVGAGVCGLTTAVCLAESGRSVHLVAREFPPWTDSCAAGAMWGPFLVEHEDAATWAKETLLAFRGLSTEPTSGVAMISGLEVARQRIDPPPWLANTGDLYVLRPHELPPNFASGWRYTTAAIDMPAYSEYLLNRLKKAGGTREMATVRSLRELAGRAPLIVNCSGGGARRLAGDPSVEPRRGRVVVVDNPGIEHFYAEVGDSAELTYFVPHGRRVVLGSTLEPTARGPLDPGDAGARIVRRCAAVEPALGRARVREVRTGYRPMRPQVRLEYTMVAGQPVIHNYGHGGGGISVSWGCARRVDEMVGERPYTALA